MRLHSGGVSLFTPAEKTDLIKCMPVRNMPLVNGECYHVLNRGVAQMPVFNCIVDYRRFLKTMLYYQTENPKPRFSLFSPETKLINQKKKIIDIICYCLMPNHFHLLLLQNRNGGISEFISKLTNSYTKYFNIKNKRIGPLFQGEFKAVHVESEEQLIHLSRYIHLNPSVGYVTKNLEIYRWSSYLEFLDRDNINTCAKEIVLGQFRSVEKYKEFVLNQEDYGKQLEFIKHQLLDFKPHPQVQSSYTPGV